MIDMAQFLKDRDEALLSLDEGKIGKYMEKYDIKFKPSDKTVFWAAVHKAILNIRASTQEQRKKSTEWLEQHGFNPYLPIR